MKTLDEVIADLECCNGGFLDDALHYLKEYQERQENLDQFETYQFVQNRPLTWQELKQMEGKPVWVEERYRNGDLKSAGWWLIDYWNDDQICLRDQGGNPWNAHRESIGRDWQAYRKERE